MPPPTADERDSRCAIFTDATPIFIFSSSAASRAKLLTSTAEEDYVRNEQTWRVRVRSVTSWIISVTLGRTLRFSRWYYCYNSIILFIFINCVPRFRIATYIDDANFSITRTRELLGAFWFLERIFARIPRKILGHGNSFAFRAQLTWNNFIVSYVCYAAVRS